ncbi:MAG: hypothetical protein WKG07_08055 [Hymenobacter sp.]
MLRFVQYDAAEPSAHQLPARVYYQGPPGQPAPGLPRRPGTHAAGHAGTGRADP